MKCKFYLSVGFAFCCFLSISHGIGDPSKNKADEYFNWLKQKGFQSDNLKVDLDPHRGGYGVYTTRNIMKGEEIIRIPQNLVLNRRSIIQLLSNNAESSENYKIIDSFREAIVELDTLSNYTNNDAHMISFLTLYERCFPNRLGYFQWIEILPETIENLIHFEDEELKHLEGSELFERTLTLRENTENFWRDSVLVVASKLYERDEIEGDWRECFGLEKWKWAMSIVSSRATFVPERGLSVVHMAEMFNHKTTHEKHRPEKYIDDNGDFVIVSAQIYPKNAQIFFDYLQPNSELLLRYGFMDEKCKHDSVGLPFGLDPNDPWYDQKVNLLNENGWQLYVYFPLEIQPSKEFMFYLRLFSANGDELELLREDTMSYFHKRITERNERAACSLMEKIAIALLNQYTEQDLHPEDEAAIRATLSPRATMAFNLAKTERRILKSMIDFAQSLFPAEDVESVGDRHFKLNDFEEEQEALVDEATAI